MSYEIIETEQIVEIEETKKVNQGRTTILDTEEISKINLVNRASINLTRDELAKFKPMPLPAIGFIRNGNGPLTNIGEEVDQFNGSSLERKTEMKSNGNVVNESQGPVGRFSVAPFKPIDLDKLRPSVLDVQQAVSQNNNTPRKESMAKKSVMAINLDAFKVTKFKNLTDKNIDLDNTKGREGRRGCHQRNIKRCKARSNRQTGGRRATPKTQIRRRRTRTRKAISPRAAARAQAQTRPRP